MKIAIGLPNSLPGTPGPDLVAWARAAATRRIVLASLLTSDDAVRRARGEIAGIDADEMFFWPMNADRHQVERLAKALA